MNEEPKNLDLSQSNISEIENSVSISKFFKQDISFSQNAEVTQKPKQKKSMFGFIKKSEKNKQVSSKIIR
jgi:hypothetical protein